MVRTLFIHNVHGQVLRKVSIIITAVKELVEIWIKRFHRICAIYVRAPVNAGEICDIQIGIYCKHNCL